MTSVGTAQKRGAMSAAPYRFDLLNEGGNRNCLFIAQCFGDEHAIILARALLESAFVRMKTIRVWRDRDDVLIHEAAKASAYN